MLTKNTVHLSDCAKKDRLSESVVKIGSNTAAIGRYPLVAMILPSNQQSVS